MAPPVCNNNTKFQWSPTGGILHTRAKLQNKISLPWPFQTWWPANVRSMGMLTADLIAINKCGSDIGSGTFTQYEARAKRSHAQSKQWNNHPCSSRVPVVAYRLAVLIWWTGNDFEHHHNLFYLFKHVCQYSGASPNIRSPNRDKNW